MTDWSFLIYLGLLLQVSGFLVREELLLRVLVALGIFCDFLFFALQTPPILPSVFSNAVLIVVNIVILAVIVVERTTINMTDREKRLFKALDSLTPGQFRRLMRIGHFHIADEQTELVVEDSIVPQMCFVEGDRFFLKKGEETAQGKGPAFIGEVAFLRGTPASASVYVNSGTAYVTWPLQKLLPMLEKSPALRNGLMTAMARDLAAKVANSLPIGPGTD